VLASPKSGMSKMSIALSGLMVMSAPVPKYNSHR
jgi:hypothetical protein